MNNMNNDKSKSNMLWLGDRLRERIVRKLERIQRVAAKMVPELSNMTYENRHTEINLTTVKQRTGRGYLIMLYKLLSKFD